MSKELDEAWITILHYNDEIIHDIGSEYVENPLKEELNIVDSSLQRLKTIDEKIEICKKVNEQKFVYCKNGPKILKICYWLDFCYDVLNNRLFLSHGNSTRIWETLDFNTYGKDWALTKEEL